jgi:hypothetical protein
MKIRGNYRILLTHFKTGHTLNLRKADNNQPLQNGILNKVCVGAEYFLPLLCFLDASFLKYKIISLSSLNVVGFFLVYKTDHVQHQ